MDVAPPPPPRACAMITITVRTTMPGGSRGLIHPLQRSCPLPFGLTQQPKTTQALLGLKVLHRTVCAMHSHRIVQRTAKWTIAQVPAPCPNLLPERLHVSRL